jgi:hypothetical protein
MKIGKLALLIVLGVICFTNCNNNDNDLTITENINGTWNLKNVSGGFSGVNVDYESEIVTWQFIPESKNIIVVNSLINNGPQSVYLPLQSGNYNYTISEINNKRFIKIEGFKIFDNGEYGKYEIKNNELVINQGEGSEANANDAFTLKFELDK